MRIQVLQVVQDVKYKIIRLMTIRCHFENYFNEGFDRLKRLALDDSLMSRGMEFDNYEALYDMFKDDAVIKTQDD